MKLHYAVVRCGDEWRLINAKGEVDAFRTSGAAQLSADGMIRAMSKMGYEVELLVQSPTGEMRRAHVASTIH